MEPFTACAAARPRGAAGPDPAPRGAEDRSSGPEDRRTGGPGDRFRGDHQRPAACRGRSVPRSQSRRWKRRLMQRRRWQRRWRRSRWTRTIWTRRWSRPCASCPATVTPAPRPSSTGSRSSRLPRWQRTYGRFLTPSPRTRSPLFHFLPFAHAPPRASPPPPGVCRHPTCHPPRSHRRHLASWSFLLAMLFALLGPVTDCLMSLTRLCGTQREELIATSDEDMAGSEDEAGGGGGGSAPLPAVLPAAGDALPPPTRPCDAGHALVGGVGRPGGCCCKLPGYARAVWLCPAAPRRLPSLHSISLSLSLVRRCGMTPME